MSVYNLSHVFSPSRVAVVAPQGASNPGDRTLLANLSRTVSGALTVVDRQGGCRATELEREVRWVPAVRELEPEPDLVVSSLPLEETPDLLKRLGDIGARSLIATCQRRTIGDETLEASVRATAREQGIRMLGLNSFGVMSTVTGLNASRFEVQPDPGHVALISQSGSLISTILDMGRQRNLGFSHVVSLGSLIDVDFGDVIDHLAWEPKVRCLMLYVENLASVKKFLSACRSAARVKPIVAIKGGSSARGRELIATHTGGVAGADAVYGTAFRRAGIIRVDSVRELISSGEAFSRGPLPRGDRLAVVTNSGGIGVLVADSLSRWGARLVDLSPALRAQLESSVTPYGVTLNPVCIGSDADTDRYVQALQLMLEAREVDTVLVVMALNQFSAPEQVVERLRPVAEASKVEMIYIWHGNRAEHGATARRLAEQGDVIYQSVEEATTAYGYSRRYAEKQANVVALPPRFDHTLGYRQDEAAARLVALENAEPGLAADLDREALLAAYGLPVNPTRVGGTLAEVSAAARELGFPVVLRVAAPGRGYQTGTANVWNPEELPGAYRRLGGDGTRVALQSILRDPRCDLRVGVDTDVEFGPHLFLGTGNLPPEAPDDRAVILPPLNRMLARKLIDHSGVAQRTDLEEAEAEQLEEILVRLSQLVVDCPGVRTLELNPLTLSRGGFWIQASQIGLEDRGVPSPQHLVTAPYPNQYEFRETLKDGTPVLMRPIRPEDGESHYAFLGGLSSRTIYNRFFGYHSEISAEQMARFTQIDYDREIAIVARVEQPQGMITIGVNRLTYDPRQGRHEFAVVVADAWQGSGIGRLLMEKIVEIAVDQGIRTIDGVILANNSAMLGLARSLGFTVVERDMEMVTVRLEC